MSTDLKPKRFTNFLGFPLDGSEDDSLFDSGTDTESNNSELGETNSDSGTIFPHSDSSDEKFL